ncbi:MAG TPA: c-type cytochrome [Thermoleophilaceae bacterium]|nr:c-type cytochrome [Thermoleophilaceae bacterium]
MHLPRTRRGRVILGGVLSLVLLGAVLAVGAWYKLFREVDQDFADVSEQFAYGSIGSESAEGLPFEIWRVLPEMFPEHLPGPGGYLSLGMYKEKGRETPVGFTKKTVGFPRTAFNCAACHSATFRTDRDGARKLVLTAPATTFDPQGYVRFLIAAGADKRFTADNILKAIARHTKLSWIDKQLYRRLIIPRTRDALREQATRFAWTNPRPDWGPGRIDPFNPVKFHQLKFDPDKDLTIGNSDMEPLWNMAPKEGFSLHWDGLDDSLTEVVLTGAIGDGASSVTGEPTDKLPVDDLKRIEDYIKKVKAPKYPFPVDRRLAARGERVFADNCASCHEFGGARTGKVIPLAEVKTDRHRLDMWTKEAAEKYNAYADGYDFDFKRFRKTDGYVAVAMDGLWLRAPYLHNGSVPSVEDLLEPARRRPKVFFRGYDVVHPRKLGFISQGPTARREGFGFDTRVAGNSNQGHEGSAYGTTLPRADKRALVEYLKTR